MPVVVTPLVVRQIQGNGRTVHYRRGPGLQPTDHFSRCFFLLPVGFANIREDGTGVFVNPFPMRLLTFP